MIVYSVFNYRKILFSHNDMRMNDSVADGIVGL